MNSTNSTSSMAVLSQTQAITKSDSKTVPLVFAAFAETDEQLRHCVYLVESIRTFGGRYADAPVMIYVPDNYSTEDSTIQSKLSALNAEIHTSHTPPEARSYYFAGKVFAAAEAERTVAGTTRVLVWMDEDTIVLREPIDFVLPEGISLTYRPVMHNRSGSLYSEPPDAYWSRIYEKLDLSENQLFPMITPADKQEIRAYFNAGLIVVRPEIGVLRAWADDFTTLYSDQKLAHMCSGDITKNIFLHQTALVGAILNRLERTALKELSNNYNYPLFFNTMFDATESFESLDDVVTLRYDVYFRNPEPDWQSKLSGDTTRISLVSQQTWR